MNEVDLTGLLEDLDGAVRTELASTPEVEDKGDDLDVDQLPIVARRWHRLTDAVAVVADLKNYTKLGTGKRASSTASIYEASTGGVVKISTSSTPTSSRSRATAPSPFLGRPTSRASHVRRYHDQDLQPQHGRQAGEAVA